MAEISAQIIKFFLDDLKPVDTGALKPDECKCIICTGDLTDAHNAVRLPCGHIFGESCIKTWLSPFATCTPVAQECFGPPVGAHTCPMCRWVFFPQQKSADFLPVLEERIKLWDKAYAEAGIALSENERQVREDLLRYLTSHSASGFDQYYPHDAGQLAYSYCARVLFYRFNCKLKGENLTPVQERLRQRLNVVSERLLNDLFDSCWETKVDPSLADRLCWPAYSSETAPLSSLQLLLLM